MRRSSGRTPDSHSAKKPIRRGDSRHAPSRGKRGLARRHRLGQRAGPIHRAGSPMASLFQTFAEPEAWAALATLIVMEGVLGIDNLSFVSILSNKLPEAERSRARRIGIGLALVLRLALLSTIAWLVGLTAPVFDLGLAGPPGAHGQPSFETAFSWRDMILIAGGLFLVWKATKEIHHTVDPNAGEVAPDVKTAAVSNVGSAIFQIILLDIVFSIDSILTAVGMTDHLPIMIVAVIVAVTVMLL